MALQPGWAGRFFEDFEVGDVYRHPLGRTLSETDNTWLTLLTGNTNQMHFNAHYSAHSEFGRSLINSGITLALVLGLSVSDLSQQAIANLGWNKVRMPHPVFVGDTLYAESLVLEARPSTSRPHAGIVTVRTRGLNQDGDVCIVYERSFLVYRRGMAHDGELFPVAETPIEAEV
jgi:itaconyl-CoA hydratase